MLSGETLKRLAQRSQHLVEPRNIEGSKLDIEWNGAMEKQGRMSHVQVTEFRFQPVSLLLNWLM